MLDTVTTTVGSFAAYQVSALTAVRYDASSGEPAGMREPYAKHRGGHLLRTAVAATFVAAVAGAPAELKAWSASDFSSDFSAEQDTKPSSQAERRSTLASEIMAYRHLPEDWDGEGGVAPSKNAIDDALAFIELLPLRAKLPKPMVAGDGEVGFYWKTENGYIDVGFLGDGTISYYARADAEQMEAKGTKPYYRNALPKDLLDVISHV